MNRKACLTIILSLFALAVLFLAHEFKGWECRLETISDGRLTD